jgi:hypothetical protein
MFQKEVNSENVKTVVIWKKHLEDAETSEQEDLIPGNPEPEGTQKPENLNQE